MGFKHFARGFDRKLVGSLVVLVIVSTVCFLAIERNRQTNSLITVAESGSVATARLAAQLDALKAQAAEDARINAEAARAAAQAAEASAAELAAVRKQNRALLNYLRERGIDVPRTLAPSGGGDDGPKGRDPQPSPSQPPASPGAPPGTPSPASPSPGVPDLLCELAPLICPST